MATRDEAVRLAQKYVGAKQGSKLHKDLVDTFNTVKPNGEVANYSCAWCAITVTAIMIKLSNGNKIAPYSYNCGTLVKLAQNMGLFVEDDAYKANAGDIIVYDWQDTSAKGDNVGSPDHVGIIEKRADGYYTVIEGNKGTTKMCGRRKIAVDGRYIRGFITPRYEISNAQKLGNEANRISWPKGTSSKKYAYDTGAPTSACKKAMRGRGYDTKIEYSDCGYFINTIIYHALGYKVKSIGKVDKAFPSVKGFKVIYSGTKLTKGQLKKYDIVRYKRVDGKGQIRQHVGMYMGNGYYAEAGRGTRFGVIHKTSKFNAKRKQIQILRVVEE